GWLFRMQDQTQYPATACVCPVAAAMGQDRRILAPAILQRVGQEGELVERRLLVDPTSQPLGGAVVGAKALRLNPARAERVPHRVAQEMGLILLFRLASRLPEGIWRSAGEAPREPIVVGGVRTRPCDRFLRDLARERACDVSCGTGGARRVVG